MNGSQSRASGAADRLVAHRGFPEAYPENSLTGVQAALEAGARFVEFDVQLSRDRVPVVVHDATLRRVGAGLDNDEEIGTLDFETLSTRRIGQPERFGEAFTDERVASLAQMLALVDRYPDTTAFVEIKSESLQRFGTATVVEAVLAELRRASSSSVAISFEAAALEAVRARSDYPIGLAIRAWDAAARRAAARLTPEYLFIRSDRIPARNRPLWPGDWHWVVYVVDDPDEACALLKRGADLIETDRIGEMIAALGQDCADAK